eukprot:PRCOL_00001772-RA
MRRPASSAVGGGRARAAPAPWGHLSQAVYALWTVAPVGDAPNGCVVTYANAVSISPRLFMVALYTHTLTRENFIAAGGGVMQLLAPAHSPAVHTLGKTSGRDLGDEGQSSSKLDALRELGLETRTWRGHTVLAGGCGTFELRLKELLPVDGGDHDLAICEVAAVDESEPAAAPLCTAALREAGIL